MKSIGYAGAAALVLWLAAFSLHGRSTGLTRGLEVPAPGPEPTLATAPGTLRDAGDASVDAAATTPDEASSSTDETSAAGERLEVRQAVPGTAQSGSMPPPADRVPQLTSRNDSRRRFRRGRRYEPPLPPPEAWTPPDGPVRIALQAGHWRASEAPPELEGLKGNGTRGGGLQEWQVNLAIAKATAAQLEAKGYLVDILPAVVPPGYRAHLFIAIHADGSNDPAARGYRIAAPRRDATHRAARMVELLEESYGRATGLSRLPTVTRRMQSYYAFNSRRYDHALDPMTIGVIIETGFLTSAADRRVIVDDPDRVARGIVDAVMRFPETPPPAQAGSDERSGGVE